MKLIVHTNPEGLAVGMIDFALRRASNIHWQALELNKPTRAALKHQSPKCIWFTGLSGSGKHTIANLLDKGLYAKARQGQLKNFTGIDSPYEAPQSPEIRLLNQHDSPQVCIEQILKSLR